ncbi:MAG: hypothetical protein N4A33_12175 [Bacteriovoracaceae bacterium]|nr:hypothetical protein [Bacteriovoracaceae bacterium]
MKKLLVGLLVLGSISTFANFTSNEIQLTRKELKQVAKASYDVIKEVDGELIEGAKKSIKLLKNNLRKNHALKKALKNRDFELVDEIILSSVRKNDCRNRIRS